jgi:hypothetical protein
MMLNKNKDAKRLVEAILFAADEPLDIETIKSKIELNVDVLKILKELQSEFIERGINLYEISNKWSFRTAENLSKKIASEVDQQRNKFICEPSEFADHRTTWQRAFSRPKPKKQIYCFSINISLRNQVRVYCNSIN